MGRSRRLRKLGVALAVVTLAVTVGCGSSKKTTSAATSTPASAAVPSVEKLVPAAVKSKGTLTVASDASYAPNEFIGPDGHTVVGMDPDLMKALGAVMGLKVKVVNVTFASILPGMQADAAKAFSELIFWAFPALTLPLSPNSLAMTAHR